MVVLASSPYYGYIEEIWEVDYTDRGLKVMLFKCKWVQSNAVVVDRRHGFTMVDLKRLLGQKKDPFVLASHVKQVFYVSDPAKTNMSNVLQSKQQIVIGWSMEELAS